MESISKLDETKCFGGHYRTYSHVSTSNGGLTMKFGIYLPERYEEVETHPVIYYLAGLTCSEA